MREVEVSIQIPVELDKPLVLLVKYACMIISDPTPEASFVLSVDAHHLIDVPDHAVLGVQNIKSPIGRYLIVIPLGILPDDAASKHRRTAVD